LQSWLRAATVARMPVEPVDHARARAEELIARIAADLNRPLTPDAETAALAEVTDAIAHDLAAGDTRHLFMSIAARRRAVAANLSATERTLDTLLKQSNSFLNGWRRHHGPAIVAQVDPLAFGRWDASTWRSNERSAAVRSPRKIATLMSAQAAADHLARTVFDHTCDLDGCGDWMFWPHESRTELHNPALALAKDS
jgi:hypothetical protein